MLRCADLAGSRAVADSQHTQTSGRPRPGWRLPLGCACSPCGGAQSSPGKSSSRASRCTLLLLLQRAPAQLPGCQLGRPSLISLGSASSTAALWLLSALCSHARARTHTGPEHDQAWQVYPPDQLEQLMAESDYVVMALPGTPATKHFVSTKALAAMKRTGVLINLGRGASLDEDALVKGASATAM